MLKKIWQSQFLVPIVFLVGIVLRIGPSMFVNLWRDEAFTINVAKLPVSEIIRVTALDTQPPLHLLLLHLIGSFAGYSEFAMRSLSILAAIVSLWLIYKIGQQLFRKRSSQIIFLIINAINPVLIYYAQEARSYALLIMFVVANVYLILRIHQQKRKILNYFLLFLIVIAGVYTSTLYFLFLAILFPVYLLYTKSLKAVLSLGLVVAAGLIFYLPWVLVTINQEQVLETNGFWLFYNPLLSPITTLATFFSGEINLSWPINLILIAIISLVSLILLMWGIKLELKHQRWQAFWSGFFIIGFLVFGVISFRVPLFYYRYMSFLTPFLLGILVIPLEFTDNLKQRKFLKILVLIFIAASLLSSLINIDFNLSAKEDYKDAIQAISYNPQTDIILHQDAQAIHGFRYYSSLPSYIDTKGGIPYYEGIASLSSNDYFNGDLNQYQRVWTFDLGDETDHAGKLQAAGFKLVNTKSFAGGLKVSLYLKEAE